jgi:hypothetical protein
LPPRGEVAKPARKVPAKVAASRPSTRPYTTGRQRNQRRAAPTCHGDSPREDRSLRKRRRRRARYAQDAGQTSDGDDEGIAIVRPQPISLVPAQRPHRDPLGRQKAKIRRRQARRAPKTSALETRRSPAHQEQRRSPRAEANRGKGLTEGSRQHQLRK